MTAFGAYLNDLQKNLIRGDATEHTHRAALQALLQSVGKGIVATNEPRHIPLIGAPDFKVSRGRVPLGNVETKDVGTDLAEMERGKGQYGEQFIRYSALPNWVLTDYLEFHWFTLGERRRVVRIAELVGKNKIKPLPDGEKQLTELLESFVRCPALTVGTAEQLADSMAGYARTMQQQTVVAIQQESDGGWLHQWLKAFQETLIPDLDEKMFSDMFAQTLVYGLFAARVHTPDKEDFTRNSAARAIPKTNPFLQELFYEITGPKLPDSIAWVMEDIVALLNHADMPAVLKDFGKGKGKEDPVVHFYETFLAAYDPKMRELRGVFYTPGPAVSYIVRSVDHLLKTRFNRPKGLADENTLILDPATGTATFIYFVVDQIYQKFAKQKGAWDGYVEKHLLNRIFGFELLIAPYAIAHLKLGMQLQQTGYKFDSDQRLGIYLTNTLKEAAKKSEQLITGWIAEEANAAANIKRDKPIMVLIGNPPYSGHSANRSWVEVKVTKGQQYVADFGLEQGRVTEIKKKAAADGVVEVPTFIGHLMQDYYVVDGAWLDERNPKWLQDDYVKFIRFAQWRIDKTGEGIVAFITNHGYLDNPTFCGMRQCVMQSFTQIYVYDLHGNSKKKECTPDGGEDKNVFDIQQGVAICLCIKERGNTKPAQVFHADLWGKREAKYKRLTETDVSTTEWKELNPTSPNYLFVPQSTKRRAEYEKCWQVTDIFPVNSMGITTGNDDRFVAFTNDELTARFKEELLIAEKVAYRPFDQRHLQYDSEQLARSRFGFMQHLKRPNNRVLITLRRPRNELLGNFFVSNCPTDKCVISSLDNAQLFPLYLHDDADIKSKKGGGGTMLMALFDKPSSGYATRRANLNPKFIQDLTQRLGLKWIPVDRGDLKKTVGPEDVFHYAYAVFHSPTYRTRYAEFLKIDFPRLPLTSDLKLFRALAAKGAELVSLHLMESHKLDNFSTTFPLKGDDTVEKVQYTDSDRRVWINAKQYFGGVPKAVWEFHVGGYQVCEKWLKDRKGRKLTFDDIQHYQRTIAALAETRTLMAQIDSLISDHGGWPLT